MCQSMLCEFMTADYEGGGKGWMMNVMLPPAFLAQIAALAVRIPDASLSLYVSLGGRAFGADIDRQVWTEGTRSGGIWRFNEFLG